MSNFHVYAGGDNAAHVPRVRRIAVADVGRALADGWRDFLAMRSDLLLVGLIYPILGVALAMWSSGANALYLVYPLMAGFALLGPIAAIGLYEVSRRREAGATVTARDALGVLKSPALPSIIVLAIMLAIVFVAWIAIAQGLYQTLISTQAPQSISQMLTEILTTRNGWTLLIVGNAIGLAIAAITFCSTVIAFPLLLDRDVGLAEAVQNSYEAVVENPVAMIAWAAAIVVALALGFATLFVGMAVVMPVLGHATWRLYRALIPKAP